MANETRSSEDDALPRTTLARDPRRLLTQKVKAGQVDGHSLVALGLRRLGVTHVYGIPAVPIHPTFAACAKQGLRIVSVHHQQAAVMMAIAQNYIRGRTTAAALVSSGPATTNAATGVLVAHDNGWPLLLLGAQRPSGMQGMGCFQELDAIPIFQSITKFSGIVESTAQIQQTLENAFHLTTNGRPGPVFLNLPQEVLEGRATSTSQPVSGPRKLLPVDGEAVSRAASILVRARRPAIVISESIRWSEPLVELSRLVDRLDAPFAASPMGRGYLPDDHPRCYTNARSFLLSTADVVLLIGAKLDWTFRFGAEIARDARLVQIAIDEEDIESNVTPDVAIAGDIKQVLQRLLEETDGVERNAGSVAPDLSWRALLDQKRDAIVAKWQALSHAGDPISPLRLIAEIRDSVPRDAIFIVDGNVILAAAQHLLPSYLPASRLTPGPNGCMGVGIPFGIGVKLGSPQRMVIVICGDFAFGVSAMEMETAVRLRVPVIFVVANNDGNGGTANQKMYYAEDYPDRVTMFVPDIHYDQVMRAFGGYSEYVDRAEQIRPALTRAAASGLAACINVRVDPDSPYPA